MVVTVEPGLYFPPGEEGIDPTWSGIGVRIEDDVLVARRGPEVLTGDIPKAPAELARARRRLG
jgi:Xaa-Pro aminopeptidase